MNAADPTRPPLTYAAAGVDLDARRRVVERIRELAKSTHRPEVLAGVGPFGGLFRLGEYQKPVLVSSTDSVGTKVRLAALLDRYESIGVDLVNQNVNDIITAGAEPLFFLDYIASSTLTEEQKAALVGGIASACREAGCALIGGETADMPDIYAPGDFDIVGFVVGAVERDELIDSSTVREGDVLLGLPSSGLHTNGFSLVRRALSIGIGGDTAADRARLERVEPELGMSLGEALLAPHRSYVREALAVRDKVKGIAHITGGGLAENVARILPDGLGARIDRSAWEAPPIFRLVQREGNVAEEELWRTFNMGIGLVLVAEPSQADAIRAALRAEPQDEALPDALVLGEVLRAEGDARVTFE
ncbi:MAG: phosphoribosylformylglycinamidine cyclo-ligase [Chloroflexi bacterium]|nr:phosphoribosylformylglycinamidine cyclo-ligase [Chloroflexota bacterium]